MQQFDLDAFVKGSHSGQKTDAIPLKLYLASFDHVIMWGAGNLGTAVGGRLREWEINNSIYWDADSEHIAEKNGFKVIEPFSGGYDKKKSLVIFCIANVAVGPSLFGRLQANGWEHIMKGTDFLEGVLCPFHLDNELDTSVCNTWNVCSVCSCERLSNLIKQRTVKKKKKDGNDIFILDRVHFIVNNFCNLRCRHCFMYMNSYKNTSKRNVDLKTMKRDIRMILNAVDSFGVVNVFGGEPFLHPQFGEIIQYILEEDNFGSVIVNTNGMADFKEEQLVYLKDPRVRLAFSNYIGSIDAEKERKFLNNISKAENADINVSVNNVLPSWNISSTLGNNGISAEEMCKKKSQCGVKFLYVHNGKVFPCSFCFSIYDLEIADYPTDYVDITKCGTARELREKIIQMMKRTFYYGCGHCDECGAITDKAGEQGFDPRYSLPEEKANV